MRFPFIHGRAVCRNGVLGIALLLLISSRGLEGAQPKPKAPPAPKPPAAVNKAGANKGAAKQAARPMPAEQLERMLNMSPEEREKTLSKLPPAQQQNVRNRLNNLDKMPPEQRALNLQRTRQLEKLSPARRQAVTQQIQGMSNLSVKEKRQILNSPDFNRNFSPDEQDLIRERFPNAARGAQPKPN